MADATVSFNILTKYQDRGVKQATKDFDGLRIKTVAIGSFIGQAMFGATKAVAGFVKSGVTMGIKTAASLEQAGIAFETLLGSGQKADVFMKDLAKFAAKTPFELPGLITASRQLIGVGASAKSVIPTLTAWGDASGALGLSQEQFNRAMLAVTQSMSKGKIQGEELMQLTEAGIPIWPLLAKAMGKTVPQLQEMSKKGQLLSKDVFPKLEAQMHKDYGGSMAKQSKTLTGLWSTFTDTLSIGLATAIEPMIPALKDGLAKATEVAGKALTTAGLGVRAMIAAFKDGDVTSDGFIGAMERIGVATRKTFDFVKNEVIPRAQSMAQWISRNRDLVEFLGGALLGAVVAIKAITTAVKLWAAAQAVLNLVMTANPIGIIVVALGALAGVFVVAWTKSQKFREVVTLVFSTVGKAVLTLVDLWLRNWKFIAGAALDAADVIVHAMAKALGWVPGLGGKLKDAAKNFDGFKAGVNTMFDKAIEKTEEWKDALDRMPREVKLKGQITDLTKKIKDAMAKLHGIPKGKLLTLTGKITDLDKKIKDAKARIKSVPLSKQTELKAKITQLVAKRKEAQKQLDSMKGNTRELKAKISQLIAQRRIAQRQIDSMRGKTVTINANTGPARAAVKKVVADYNAMLNRISDEDVRIKLGISGQALAALRSASISLAREHLNRPRVATGGPIPGHSPSPTADNVPIMATAGEHMWSVREVAGAGGHSKVAQLRKEARSGTLQLAAGGPIVKLLGGGSLQNMRIAAAIAGDTRRAIAASYRYQLQAIVNAAAAAGAGGPTSPGLVGALRWARSQAGKPYIWGGVGPRGYDCSGFQSAILNRIQGRSTYSRRGSTGTFPWPGFITGTGAYMIGSFRGSPGHMAGTLNGVNVESRGGEGVVVGARARGARHSMFSTVRKLKGYAAGGAVGEPAFDYLDPRGLHFIGDDLKKLLKPLVLDQGGWLQPGYTLAHNRTGRPERVLPPNRGNGATVHNHYHFPNYVGDKNDLVRALEDLRRQRRLPKAG